MENKYIKIANYIKKAIESGKLKPGNRAPSILNLCDTFKCSKATVIRAYEELQKEHILYSIPKSGFYVVERNVKKHNYDDAIIDFSTINPSENLLPYEEFQHSINQAIKIYKDSLFSYSDKQVNTELRKALKNHFRDYSIFTKIENIAISSGCQQAIYILSKIPFPNGKSKVLIEQPTYYGVMKAVESNNITAIGINRDINGINLDELEQIFKTEDIKFFYIIPRFHNPTGFSLSNNQKRQILKLAEKYDVYIVEDDYLGDLDMNSKNETMYSMDITNRVIYIKSFSKTLLPGLRLAALILPEAFVNSFLYHKACCDLITNSLSQGALEIYLKSKMYDNHLKHIKKFYSQQMSTLKDAINREFQDAASAFIPSTGFFASIKIPDSINIIEFENALINKKVSVLNIQKMFLNEYKQNDILRLSMCNVNTQQIYKGIKLISQEIQNRI